MEAAKFTLTGFVLGPRAGESASSFAVSRMKAHAISDYELYWILLDQRVLSWRFTMISSPHEQVLHFASRLGFFVF